MRLGPEEIGIRALLILSVTPPEGDFNVGWLSTNHLQVLFFSSFGLDSRSLSSVSVFSTWLGAVITSEIIMTPLEVSVFFLMSSSVVHCFDWDRCSVD
jgi:hypothetical protein